MTRRDAEGQPGPRTPKCQQGPRRGARAVGRGVQFGGAAATSKQLGPAGSAPGLRPPSPTLRPGPAPETKEEDREAQEGEVKEGAVPCWVRGWRGFRQRPDGTRSPGCGGGSQTPALRCGACRRDPEGSGGSARRGGTKGKGAGWGGARLA